MRRLLRSTATVDIADGFLAGLALAGVAVTVVMRGQQPDLSYRLTLDADLPGEPETRFKHVGPKIPAPLLGELMLAGQAFQLCTEMADGDLWGAHRTWSRKSWRDAVAEEETNLGYWAWVSVQLDLTEDDEDEEDEDDDADGDDDRDRAERDG